MEQSLSFELHGKYDVTAGTWTGTPTVLLYNQNATMAQTTNGTMILSATNQSTQNNAGTLAITSGGGAPVMLNLPALANQPVIQMQNWAANNLSVTNVSSNSSTSVMVQAVGPGLPGITAQTLTIGTPLPLAFGQVAQGNTNPQYMQLVIQSNAATLGVVGVIGGPTDNQGNNGMVIAVNATANTGPGTGVAAPAGYYATTTSNTYTYSFNWSGSSIFVANLSPSTAQSVSVTVRAL